MILEWYVKNKNNITIENAIIEIKGDDFITIYKTESNEKGYYKFDLPAGKYPFLIAVKDYSVNYLEYWCQNIQIQQNMCLDVSFDTLEVYGLHVFSVKGSGNSLMVYFRPMSLAKYQQGEQNIAPDNIEIKVTIDGKEMSVLNVNKVKEFSEEREMTAYLVQIKTSETDKSWSKLDIQIKDKDNNYGAATIFNI